MKTVSELWAKYVLTRVINDLLYVESLCKGSGKGKGNCLCEI